MGDLHTFPVNQIARDVKELLGILIRDQVFSLNYSNVADGYSFRRRGYWNSPTITVVGGKAQNTIEVSINDPDSVLRKHVLYGDDIVMKAANMVIASLKPIVYVV